MTTADANPQTYMATFKGEGLTDVLRDKIVAQIKKVYDPEIPVDVYELGLIYGVEAKADGSIAVLMTLTSPNCPSAEQIPVDIEKRLKEIEGAAEVKATVTFDPPWTKEKMSQAALLELGFDV